MVFLVDKSVILGLIEVHRTKQEAFQKTATVTVRRMETEKKLTWAVGMLGQEEDSPGRQRELAKLVKRLYYRLRRLNRREKLLLIQAEELTGEVDLHMQNLRTSVCVPTENRTREVGVNNGLGEEEERADKPEEAMCADDPDSGGDE